MGGGLAFLSKKRFNPSNFSNRALVWEAKQKANLEERKTKERLEQLKREREDEELARAVGGKVHGDAHQLKFMYDAPPGLSKKDQRKEDSERKPSAMSAPVKQEDHEGDSIQFQCDNFLSYESHPGDDDAAAEFRKMLQKGSEQNLSDKNRCISSPFSKISRADGSNLQLERGNQEGDDNDGKGNVDSSKPDTRTKLEKEAGKSIQGKAVTLKEQFERFPQLKNAPIAEGISVDNAHVAFKPMGETLRNVRCLKCGQWGHSVGDRECKLTGWNPFEVRNSSNAADLKLKNSYSQFATTRSLTSSKRDRTTGNDNKCQISVTPLAKMNQPHPDPSRAVLPGDEYRKRKSRKRSHDAPGFRASSESDVSSISSHDVSIESSDDTREHKRRRRDRKDKKKRRRRDRHRHRSSHKKDKKHRKQSRDLR